MAGLRLKRATNKVVVGGTEPVIEEMNIETVANMYAGRLVEKGTNDDDCELNSTTSGDMNPLGWLGYEQCAPEYKPATKATIYTVGAKVPVLKGSGFILDALAVDTSGETIAKGDYLMPTDTLGGVKKFADTDPSTNKNIRVAQAEESVTIPAAGSIAILVRSLI
jgi:hypothetical protein